MNINIKKKALSLLCASCVLVTSNVYAEMKVENDYVDAKTDVVEIANPVVEVKAA